MTISRNHYLKPFSFFKESLEDKAEHRSLLAMGMNTDKSIFKKIPKSDQEVDPALSSKFQHLWLSKSSTKPANEVISSDVFRVFLGEQCSPKYRLCVENDNLKCVMTRLLDHFTPWKTYGMSMETIAANELPLDYRGVTTTDYGQFALKYLKITGELINFEKMLAVSLLLGKEDVHAGNWGIVDVNGKKYAATVDHELAFTSAISMYNLLYKRGHRKERLLTNQFVTACREVIAEYESKKEYLKDLMVSSISAIRPVLSSRLTIESILFDIEKNKNDLLRITYQIEAEMAIKQGNAVALREALNHLPIDYFPEQHNAVIKPILISLQNYKDGFIDPNGPNLREFIMLRKVDDGNWLHGKADSDEDGYRIYDKTITDASEEYLRITNELLTVFDEVAAEKQGNSLRDVPTCGL